MLDSNFQNRAGTRLCSEFGVRLEALHPENLPPVMKDDQFISQASRNFLFNQNFFQFPGPRSNPVTVARPPVPNQETVAWKIEQDRAFLRGRAPRRESDAAREHALCHLSYIYVSGDW